jgi:hypothetical protein
VELEDIIVESGIKGEKMGNKVACTSCGTEFNKNNYYDCPQCKTPYIEVSLKDYYSDPVPEVQKTRKSTTPSKPLAQKADVESELVRAQNRTTHAVRALAITFVAAPIIFMVVAGMIVLAASSGDTALTIMALLVGLFAFGWTLVSSLSELAKSKVN